ncbi:MAG: hypothetical protein JSR79_06880 [Proteobacteria bacterium]|nr:hypothetical protein [Pseudomonadota bacterium]
MTLRAFAIIGGVGLTIGLAGCSQPTPPPRFVPTVAPVKPPPPVLPPGGYPDIYTAPRRPDGTYIPPHFDTSDGAAVWQLRGALNVAALGCDQAGGGVVDGYNAWLRSHSAILTRYFNEYLRDWEETGWNGWRDAFENQQTRFYNFYSQSPIRTAFCAAARIEIARVAAVSDADLPAFARASLARLDQPFFDFYRAVDAWRDYYHPNTPPPQVVRTIPDTPPEPAVATSDASAPVAPPDSQPAPTGATPK